MNRPTYENMSALVKKYYDLLPKLSPDNKKEMDAICTPDCVFSYPEGQTTAEFVSSRWHEKRYHVHYDSEHPLYIRIDEAKQAANSLIREEVRAAVGDKLIEENYLRETFLFGPHDGKIKIKAVFTGPQFADDIEWQWYKKATKPTTVRREDGVTYESMLALIKAYCEMLPYLSPENKHMMDDICTPDCVFPYPDGETEAEFVTERWHKVRFHLLYEPHPLFIHIDDRMRAADCLLKEEVRDAKSGELIDDYFLTKPKVKWKPGLGGIVYLRESFQFAMHDGKAKISDVCTRPRVDPNSLAFQRWKDLGGT